ncbi:MAG: radical SAM protein [Bacteroidia bacterium]|nr:radical SAM protein [Bacteroidia bacterium]
MRPYPPLGILYISAFLEENGLENTVFDTTFSEPESLYDFITAHKPAYLLVYVNLMTKINVLRLIRFVRSQPELNSTRIILGGPEVKYHAAGFLENQADFLVIGEGEMTTWELLQALESGAEEKIHGVQGLAFRDAGGKVVFTEERTKVRDIDVLPLPNRKKIDLQKYLDTWRNHHGKNTLSVSTMRGCPYTCKWCSRAVYGLSYRRRSPRLVVEELLYLQKTWQPDSIWFVDDVFTVSHKWLTDFRDAVLAHNLHLPYECITRADRMNEAVIQLLKESGCFRVWIGAESGSQKVIDQMDRRVDVNQVREMIVLARKYGIEAGTFIMLGYPGETEADIEETIHHLKTANPDHFTITIAYPIKGTDLYREVESTQITQPNWTESTDRDIDFVRTYPRKYYNWAVRRVVNEVNFHKNRLIHPGYSFAGLGFKTRSVVAKAVMWWIRTR